MLAPIARLLEISLETLLSFREELTTEEITALVDETSERLKKESYEDVFLWVKGIIEQYPNCENLIWQLAVLLDAHRITKAVENEVQYDDAIAKWYERGLESSGETIKSSAAESLSALYIRREQYEKAEEYLKYFPADSPVRRQKQALIYSRTNRRLEAYKMYEEMMFTGVNILNMVISSLYGMAIEDQDMEKARFLAEKGSALAEVFEMGAYNGLVHSVQIAMDEQDFERAKERMEQLLESVGTIDAYRHSRLYEHMTFKELRPEFVGGDEADSWRQLCGSTGVWKGVIHQMRNNSHLYRWGATDLYQWEFSLPSTLRAGATRN